MSKQAALTGKQGKRYHKFETVSQINMYMNYEWLGYTLIISKKQLQYRWGGSMLYIVNYTIGEVMNRVVVKPYE